MRLHPKWKLAVGVWVALALAVNQMEAPALAQIPSNSTQSENAARPEPSQIATVAPPASLPATAPRQSTQPDKSKKRGVLKWVLIAVAGGATAILLKSAGSADPAITVGAPTVGQPQ
jgi:hypothetical protein